MEYLQLLLILQHIAVGGTALAGFTYLFVGSESVTEFLKREIKEWTLRTTLLWVTGSFALGYVVEDTATQMIDGTRGRLYVLNTFVDRAVHNTIIRSLFETDDMERFYALFDWAPKPSDQDSRPILVPPGSQEYFTARPLLRELWLTYKSSIASGRTATELTASLDVDERETFGELFYREFYGTRSTSCLNTLLDETDPSEELCLALPLSMPVSALKNQPADLATAKNLVNGLYYQAHNLVVAHPSYADELARIEQRRNFFRALGFLAEIFFILFGLWASVYPVPRSKWWDGSLVLTSMVFVNTLCLQDIHEFISWISFFVSVTTGGLILLMRKTRSRQIWCGFLCARFAWLKPALEPRLFPIRRSELGVDGKSGNDEPDFLQAYLKSLLSQLDTVQTYFADTKSSKKDRTLSEGEDLLSDFSRAARQFRDLLQSVYYVPKQFLFSPKQAERSTSLARFAVLAFVVVGICTIGSHAESMSYNLRVFGYYIVSLTHSAEKESTGER